MGAGCSGPCGGGGQGWGGPVTTHADVLMLTLAVPARTAGGQCCAVHRAVACLVDARTYVCAPPVIKRIYVVPLIDWTSLRLVICAGGWVLAALTRSTRPIRGRVLGSFTVVLVDAELPAGVPGSLRLPRFPTPVLGHQGPVGLRGGAALVARTEPLSAVASPLGEAALAEPPLDSCAATSLASLLLRLEPSRKTGAAPSSDLPLASDRDPLGGDRRPRSHPRARAAGWRLPAPTCIGHTCGSAPRGASSR